MPEAEIDEPATTLSEGKAKNRRGYSVQAATKIPSARTALLPRTLQENGPMSWPKQLLKT